MTSRRWIGRSGWLAVVLALVLGGCSLLPPVRDETFGWSAEKLYQNAHEAMQEGNYTRAVKLFDTLEARYPYGRYAQQGILESAYSSWREGEQETAAAACDRFIQTYPNNANVDYAYYLKGLIHFREDQGLFGYVYELDLSERDPKQMRQSFDAFKELVRKFPKSRYTEDALDRMRYLANALGMYEVHVARYYYDRGAYIAAVNRAQASLVNYPRTPSNADALEIMVEGYRKLGMPGLADDSKRVLEKTFPESPYVSGVSARPWWKLW